MISPKEAMFLELAVSFPPAEFRRSGVPSDKAYPLFRTYEGLDFRSEIGPYARDLVNEGSGNRPTDDRMRSLFPDRPDNQAADAFTSTTRLERFDFGVNGTLVVGGGLSGLPGTDLPGPGVGATVWGFEAGPVFKTGVTRFSPALYDQVNDLRGIIDGADLGRPTLLDAESLDRARPGIVQPFTGTTSSIDDLLQPPAGGPAGASP